MIPWNLYNLTVRDQAGPLVRPFNKSETQTPGIGVPATQTSIVVPDEFMLLVTAISIRASSAADGVARVDVIIDQQGTTLHKLREYPALNFSVNGEHRRLSKTWSGNPLFLVPEKSQFILSATLSVVSTVAWGYDANLSGVLIPRGTISLT